MSIETELLHLTAEAVREATGRQIKPLRILDKTHSGQIMKLIVLAYDCETWNAPPEKIFIQICFNGGRAIAFDTFEFKQTFEV